MDPEIRRKNDRKLVALALRNLADQIEGGVIDGFKIEWELGDELMKTELKLPASAPLKAISIKIEEDPA